MNVNDFIKIKKVGLGSEDYYTLNQLYLPLIGVNSYTIYTIFQNILEDEVKVSRVLDILNLTSVKTIDQGIMRLEGIGLVNRYLSSKDETLLVFNKPLDTKSFLKNTLLKNYLVSKIGEVEVENIINSLKPSKVKGYKDVTLSFDEVYKTVSSKIEKSDVFVNDEVLNTFDIKIKNTSFDYLIFKMSLDNIIPIEVLNDSDFENQILKISYQYNLNEQELKEACMKAMTISKDLKFEDISKCAGYIYQSKTTNQVLGFDVKNVEEYKHELTNSEEELLRYCDNISIEKLLSTISGGKASLADVKDYLKLKEVTNLEEGVINVLILYLFDLKKDTPLTFTYIEKVMRNWMKMGVRTTKDAIKYLNEKKKEENKPTSHRKRTVDTPEWMKREKDNVEVVEETVSEEELEEAKELAKKLLG